MTTKLLRRVAWLGMFVHVFLSSALPVVAQGNLAALLEESRQLLKQRESLDFSFDDASPYQNLNRQVATLLREAKTLANGNSTALAVIAELAYELFELDLALEAAREAIEHSDRKLPYVQIMAARILYTQALFAKDDSRWALLDEALARALDAVDGFTNPSPDALFTLGMVLQLRNEVAQAHARYKEALAVAQVVGETELSRYYRSLSQTADKLERLDESLEWFGKLVETGLAMPLDWIALADGLHGEDNWALAINTIFSRPESTTGAVTSRGENLQEPTWPLDDPMARFELGERYLGGDGVPEDDWRAWLLFRSAAEQEVADAQYMLAVMYSGGTRIPKSDTEAVEWYRLAAEQGHAGAQFNLGSIYADGRGVQENDTEAVKWYRLAAEQGHARAQFSLGRMYANGEGVPENDAEAVKWYRLAAEQGDASAQFNLGLMYANGEGVPENDTEAAKWYRLAAEQGDAFVQFRLGLMYANGEGVPENDAEAVKWYRLAAEQGDASAQFNLGLKYDIGAGVPENDTEAAKWYHLAAEQGHAGAQFSLGVMYANGERAPGDDTEAVKWYRLAAEQGHAHAQFNLGFMYYKGRGVQEDDTEAVKWFRAAADQGDANAQFNLGVMHAAGDGVLRSGAAAADWYYKAGLSYLADQDRQTALLCVERIRDLETVLHLTVPNVCLADELLRLAYGAEATGDHSGTEAWPQQEAVNFGTGWVTAEGYVVTNFHVVQGHEKFALLLDDGTSLDAELALADQANDLALLKLSDINRTPVGLPLASREPETGTPVFTLGYPHPDFMGAEVKLTDGIVSARSGLGGDIRVLQISVPVQAGNSGGPLLNMNGEVVGVVVAKLDGAKILEWTGDLPENVNFAVKAAYLRPLIDSAREIRRSVTVTTGTTTLVELVDRVRGSVVLVVAQ